MENNEEWSIAVDGAQISAMDEDKRYGTIVTPAPEYKKDEQAPNAERQKIKLIAKVRLSDGRIADYYMNRTSARFIAAQLQTDLSAEGMKAWVGAMIFWGKILDQMIGGQPKKVLYVDKVEKADLTGIATPVERTDPIVTIKEETVTPAETSSN